MKSVTSFILISLLTLISISCSDAGKDCGWSATAESEEELMSKVTEHVLSDHKEIELNAENISIEPRLDA